MLMTKQFVKRNTRLSLEFDSYLAKHPDLYYTIPNGAVVVVTIKSDKKFTEESLAVAKKHSTNQTIVQAEKYKSNWTVKPLQISAA